MIDIDIKVKPAKQGFIIHLEGEGQSIDLIRVPNNFDAQEMAKELRLELARQVMILAFQELRDAPTKPIENYEEKIKPDALIKGKSDKPKRKPRAKKQPQK